MKKIIETIIVLWILLVITLASVPIRIFKAEGIEADFDIQDAIENANNGDIIVVPDGRYDGGINFLGKAITVMSEHGPDQCIIDGWLGTFGVKFDTNETADSILQGFTITNCKAEQGAGGGIYCGQYTSPTIIDCIITGNVAQGIYQQEEGIGGGVYCDRFSSPTLLHCQITNNQAR